MPLTSKEIKAALIEHTVQLLQIEAQALEEVLDAQGVAVDLISYNTIQIKVLPANRGAWRYFTLKISEAQ